MSFQLAAVQRHRDYSHDECENGDCKRPSRGAAFTSSKLSSDDSMQDAVVGPNLRHQVEIIIAKPSG